MYSLTYVGSVANKVLTASISDPSTISRDIGFLETQEPDQTQQKCSWRLQRLHMVYTQLTLLVGHRGKEVAKPKPQKPERPIKVPVTFTTGDVYIYL